MNTYKIMNILPDNNLVINEKRVANANGNLVSQHNKVSNNFKT